MEWETVIGLEIHAQLATKSKIFSGASTAYGAAPNTQACAIDLGLPGVLPVLNREAVRMAAMLGLAIGAEVARRSVFARKNYFYPDLPKGYQISQYELPVVQKGQNDHRPGRRFQQGDRHHPRPSGRRRRQVAARGFSRSIRDRLEPRRDAVAGNRLRAGYAFGQGGGGVYEKAAPTGGLSRHLRRQHAGRFVPLRRQRVGAAQGRPKFGTRAEIKNLNSFRFVERAIEFEIERQIDLIESGGKVVQETRLYDPDKGETRSMRGKEEANDYRYFPDPDLLPLVLDDAFIDAARAALPELPDAKKQRFMEQYGLSAYDASVLTTSRELAGHYEATVAALGGEPKLCANWVMGDFSAFLNKDNRDIADSPVDAAQLAGLLRRIQDRTISGKIAKEVFEAMWAGEGDADAVIEKRGLRQITDTSAIEKVIDDVIAANPDQLAQYRAGKDKLFGFFVGQVMKLSKGKANPQQVNDLLVEKLKA